MQNLTSIGPLTAGILFKKQSASQELRDVAEQFEALFIHQILKQGRSAKLAEDLLGGEATDTYNNMLDQERANKLATSVNLGIAEALIAQFQHVEKSDQNE
jgi:flagellar protein FlgJ